MGSRQVPFKKDEACDYCRALWAFDFMGDLLCEKCANFPFEAAHDRSDYRSYCSKDDEDTDVANLEALRMRAESAERELAAYKQAIDEAAGLSHDFNGKGSCLEWIKHRATELPANT